MAGLIGSDGLAGVYWQGQDGNTYTKNNLGQTTNAGAHAGGVGSVLAPGNKATINGLGYRAIADPNVQTPAAQTGGTAPSDPNNTSGSGGSATTYQDKSNDISMQNAGLASADATQQSGIDAINKSLGTIMGEYDDDANNAKTEYTNESNSNQQDLQGNKETALQDAVQGRQGLLSELGSIGALNGTGLQLATHAVQQGANSDLTNASDTFATNQNGLDSGYNAFTAQDKTRRTQAQAAADNDTEQVKNDTLKSKSTILKALGDDYQAEGNTTQAKNYYDQLNTLFPSIAATSVPTIDLGYSGSAYTAPTLSQYVGKANNTTVQSTPAGATSGPLNIPGLIAVNKKQAS